MCVCLHVKLSKKILALLLAVTLTFGLGVPALAEDITEPEVPIDEPEPVSFFDALWQALKWTVIIVGFCWLWGFPISFIWGVPATFASPFYFIQFFREIYRQ